MASRGVKRKAELEGSLKRSEAWLTKLKDEVATIKQELESKKKCLVETKAALVYKETLLTGEIKRTEEARSHADHWKELYFAAEAKCTVAANPFQFLHANQQQAQQQAQQAAQEKACESLKLSLSLVQQELKVCKQKLNLSAGRAEKAERNKEVLSARLGEIEDLVEGFG